MSQLDLIRAAAEDVASARVLLRERTEALEAIVQTALEHGATKAQVAEASGPSLADFTEPGDTPHVLAAA
ncbi:hypothetical protein [Paeniglutamicibacter sp. NPDC091659]|uniref:hypothetical protein n=1 Tax=Paeniglutamicibacter sp. NPDC091659 TaxID=3364389 RepID=UPI003817DA27